MELYYIGLSIEFGPDKDATDVAKHHISLSRAVDFEMLAVLPDTRFNYGEARFRACGLIDGEIYRLTFTTRSDKVRAISYAGLMPRR